MKDKGKPFPITMNTMLRVISDNNWWEQFNINNLSVHVRIETEVQRATRAVRKSNEKKRLLLEEERRNEEISKDFNSG